MKAAKKKVKTTKTKIKPLELIDFDTFFYFAQREKLVRPEQKNEIQIFFTQNGLTNKETKSKFKTMLKQY